MIDTDLCGGKSERGFRENRGNIAGIGEPISLSSIWIAGSSLTHLQIEDKYDEDILKESSKMEIKKIGNPAGKKVMLLHGNLMCWKQFEDVIPFLEEKCFVYAVSFDGFDGTGKTTYTNAQNQAEKLAKYLKKNSGGRLDMLFAESLGCGPAVMLMDMNGLQIDHMILSGPEYLNFGILNSFLLKVMPKMQYKTVKTRSMPVWALKFMGQTEEGMKTMMNRIPDNISLESIRATWKVGLNLYKAKVSVRHDAKVACWYGENEGHMKKAIEKLRQIYPQLVVKCFEGYGHGEIMNHPEQLTENLFYFLE